MAPKSNYPPLTPAPPQWSWQKACLFPHTTNVHVAHFSRLIINKTCKGHCKMYTIFDTFNDKRFTKGVFVTSYSLKSFNLL